MKKVAVPHLEQQEKVNALFQSQSSYWKDIYAADNVQSEIYRERHAAALDWVDSLDLAPRSRVLEIGCGAGFMAIELARRGFRVQAIDSTEVMIEQVRRHAAESETAELLSADIGDTYSLAFEDGSFDIVLALGVIPWLERPELAIQEMARVTRPGGHVLLSADNRARLIYLPDPLLNPVLRPLRKSMKAMLVATGLRSTPEVPVETLYSTHFIDKVLASAELTKTRSRTLGFGPFSFLRRTLLPKPLGIALHHRLQHLADKGMPVLRSGGAQYLVLARKRTASSPLVSDTTNTENDEMECI